MLSLTATASARTWYVHPSGTGDAPNIQAAIDSSSHGDVIELANGTFTGTGNRDLDYTGKRIIIRSQSGDPSLCTINCGGTMADPHRAVYFSYGEDSLSVLRDVTITEGSYTSGGAIHIEESSPLIARCVFVGNQADEGAGIYTYNSNSIIRGCWFEDNYAGVGGAGIYISDESPEIETCTFVDNMTAGDGGGVYCDNNVAALLMHCTFYANEAWGIGSAVACYNTSPVISLSIVAFGVGAEAIGCGTGSSPVLTCSDLYGNAGGNWVGCISSQNGTNGNISENPRFCNPGAGDFTLHTSSPCKTGGTGCGLQGAWPVGCAARTFVLNDAGTGDFPTIQAAVDVAWDGDTIELMDGTYTGEGNRDIQIYGKALTLRGQSGDASSCIVDAGDEAGHWGVYIGGIPDLETYIEDITFTGADAYSAGGGVECGDCKASILRCIFRDNVIWSGSGAGLWAGAACSLYVSECIFEGNSAGPMNGGGLAVYGYFEVLDSEFSDNWGTEGSAIRAVGADGTILGCTFHSHTVPSSEVISLVETPAAINACTFAGNSGTSGAVITSSGYAQPVFNNCIIAFNTDVVPVACVDSFPSLGCCDIYGNDAGDWIGCIAGQAGLTGNFSADPRFCNAAGLDFELHISSPCTPANSGGCGLVGAHGVGCGPETYVLNDAGTGDFPTIQAAIDAAWDGDIIELLDGTYTGDGNRDLDTKSKAITLRSQSGNASSCIIDAEGDSLEQHRVITIQGGALETRLEDMTITGGYFIGVGGGVACLGSTAGLHGCIFSNNTSAYAAGGGVYIAGDCMVTVTECVFTGNVALSGDGGGLALLSDLTMSDCELYGNDAELGAALWALGSAPGGRTASISDCEFHDHSIATGSVVMLHHMYGEVTRCTFYNNTTPEGALYLKYRNPLISECTFYQNTGGDCAALRTWSCSSEISQCTFADNASAAGSAMLTGGYPQPEMDACILAFNTTSTAVACTDSFPELSCCDIYGNDLGDWVGCIAGEFGNDGNIRMDPLFCGDLNPDSPYSLQLESPCMADSAPPGCPRLGAHDVGCQGGSGVEEPWATETMFMSGPLPNPSSAATQITFALPPGALHEKTRLDVYDITGRRVRGLLDRIIASGELQAVTWDGCDEKGKPVASGVYFFRLESGGEARAAKVVITR